MTDLQRVEVAFQGPFRLAGGTEPSVFECALSESSGLYLWGGPADEGKAWITYVGETKRPFRTRFIDHLERTINGSYSVLSVPDCRQGITRNVWDGYGWRRAGWRGALEHLNKLDGRVALLRTYLEYIEIWLAPLPALPQLNHRAEAALLRHLRAQGGPTREMVTGNKCHHFDDADRLFNLRFSCPRTLHGFPEHEVRA